MERKERVGITEKGLAIHSCSWAKTGTQLPPGFPADLPTARSVSLTPGRSQLRCRGFSVFKNQCKAARVVSIWQASVRVGTHPCCSPAQQETPRRLSRSLPFQTSTWKTCSTWVMGMRNPLITSRSDPVNENVVDEGLEIYSLGWALEPGRSSRGMV